MYINLSSFLKLQLGMEVSKVQAQIRSKQAEGSNQASQCK